VGLALAAVATFAFNIASPSSALEAVLTLFIVTCPCALAFSVPTIYGLAVGEAAARGILVKSARVLEDLTRVEYLFTDKTGTITSGTYALKKHIWHTENQLPALSALEAMTALQPKHPVSAALRSALGLNGTGTETCMAVPGRGVELAGEDATWRLGAPAWATDEIYAPAGGCDTTLVLTRDSILAAEFVLGDSLRAGSKEALVDLKKNVRSITVLSGDGTSTVRAVAEWAGLDGENAFGSLTPEEKASIIARCSRPSMYVGDGVNDVLALQSATVGVAISGGLEATVEAADIVITNGSLESVADVTRAARRARKLVLFSLGVSLVYNVTAAAVTIAGHMNPLIAAFLMPTSSASVMGLALIFEPFGRNQ
jgi:cation transport ATPase